MNFVQKPHCTSLQHYSSTTISISKYISNNNWSSVDSPSIIMLSMIPSPLWMKRFSVMSWIYWNANASERKLKNWGTQEDKIKRWILHLLPQRNASTIFIGGRGKCLNIDGFKMAIRNNRFMCWNEPDASNTNFFIQYSLFTSSGRGLAWI